jgi:hypothetical protein
MTDVVKIGSQFSDGDLVIENLTTLTKAGAARNTDAITITMDHTDNYNSDIDASDLTVYFDEDYLLTGQSTGGASLIIDMSNALSIKTGGSPVEGFTSVSFSVGTTDVLVDVTGAASYTEVVTRINAKLTELGLTTVKAETMAQKDVRFSIDLVVGTDDVITYSNGELAGQYSPIIVTNTGAETLMQGSFDKSDVTMDATIANSQRSTAATTTVNPLAVNIELEKVGRDGEGGNLVVGGKELDRDGGATTKGNGIDQFDILVTGTSAQPSNLGYITSTNNALQTVNISSAAGSTASLTVRDAFASNENANTATGANVETVNANSFVNDLNIGEDTAMMNVDTFTATGGGKITLNAEISGVEKGNFSMTTGENTDTVTVSLDGDAVDTIGTGMTINTNGGNDTVTVTLEDVAGASVNTNVSQRTMDILNNLNINTAAGDDKVEVKGEGNYNITTSTGSDFVYFNSTNVDENGTAGVITFGQLSGAQTFVDRPLYNAELTISFAGFEQTVTIATTAANQFKATQLDINTAIKNAIATNVELSKLLTVADSTGNQALTVTSNVDGANDIAVAIYQPELVAQTAVVTVAGAGQTLLSTTDATALRQGIIASTLFTGDSSILETNVEIAAYTNGAVGFEGSVAANAVADNTNYTYTRSDVVTDAGVDTAFATTATQDIFDLAALYQGYTVIGTDSTVGINYSDINMGSGDHDLLVLDSNDLSAQNIIIDQAFGKVSIVNFHDVNTSAVTTAAVVGNHTLDFEFYLTNKTDASIASVGNTNNTDSAVDIATTVNVVAGAHAFGDSAPLSNIAVADSINIIRFDENTGESFSTLNADILEKALNGQYDDADADTTVGDNYGNLDDALLSAVTTTANLVGTTNQMIIMVENDLNEGEYKVFSTTSNQTDNDFASTTLLGTLDFGASVNLNAAGTTEYVAFKSALAQGLLETGYIQTVVDAVENNTTVPDTGTETPTETPTTGTTTTVSATGITTQTIANFVAGDVIDFPTANISISNPVLTDGEVILTWNDGTPANDATVTVTGISATDDANLYSVAQFDAIFGAGTIA